MKNLRTNGTGQTNRQFLAIAGLALAAIALSVVSQEAVAQVNGAMSIPQSDELLNQMTALHNARILVPALAYLGALVFGIMGALKLKTFSDPPNRNPLKVPIAYMAVAAVFAALPEFLV